MSNGIFERSRPSEAKRSSSMTPSLVADIGRQHGTADEHFEIFEYAPEALLFTRQPQVQREAFERDHEQPGQTIRRQRHLFGVRPQRVDDSLVDELLHLGAKGLEALANGGVRK